VIGFLSSIYLIYSNKQYEKVNDEKHDEVLELIEGIDNVEKK
jgi:hypothetical protein